MSSPNRSFNQPGTSLLEETAEWVAALRYEDIPARIVQLAKSQAASVFASAHAGLLTEVGQTVLESLRSFATTGDVPIVGTGETAGLEHALLANSALGMTQDYDDYLFMGHTGHSAVWVAHLLGATLGSSGKDILAAQIAASEVAGRMGAACVLGPQNGQLWTHIHLAGAAVAAGKLLGLSSLQMANALGIAYAQPVYGLFPGFMGPDSKVLSAATPSVTGLTAARLAQGGMTGDRRIWEGKQGFLKHFSYRPIEGMLSGWGSSWISDTLAVKPYPGCAYIDTTIDGLLDLLREHPDVEWASIESIDIKASLLSIEMNHLSESYAGEELLPIFVNFNLAYSAAVALFAGRLTPVELTKDYLEKNRPALDELAKKITVRHDTAATLDLLEALAGSIGASRFFGGMTFGDLRYLRMRLRRDGHARLDAKMFDLGTILARLFTRRGSFLRGLWRKGGPKTLNGVDFRTVTMPFRSTVTMRAGGKTLTVSRELPRGSASFGDIHQVAREKWCDAPGVGLSAEKRVAAWELLKDAENRSGAELLAAFSAPAGSPSPLNRGYNKKISY